MALLSPLFNENLAYSAQVTRHLVGGAFTPGVFGPNDLRVTPRAQGANWSVDISAGAVAMAGQNTDGGLYLCKSTATVNFAPAGWAAPPGGQQRRDIIIAEVLDTEPPFSQPTDEWRFRLLTGTPSPNPVAPTVPTGAIPLCRINTTASTTSIATSNIVDLRPKAGDHLSAGSIKIGQYTAWANNSAGGWMNITGQPYTFAEIKGVQGPAMVMAWWLGAFHRVSGTGPSGMGPYIGISINGGWGSGDVSAGASTVSVSDNQLSPSVAVASHARAGTVTGDVLVGVAFGTAPAGISTWTEGRLSVLVVPNIV